MDGKQMWVEYNTKIPKIQKKRASTLRYMNLLRDFSLVIHVDYRYRSDN
jgi:hypothetical protein